MAQDYNAGYDPFAPNQQLRFPGNRPFTWLDWQAFQPAGWSDSPSKTAMQQHTSGIGTHIAALDSVDWSGYLQRNPDVQQAWDQNQHNIQRDHGNVNTWALAHYLGHGQREGRSLFDPEPDPPAGTGGGTGSGTNNAPVNDVTQQWLQAIVGTRGEDGTHSGGLLNQPRDPTDPNHPSYGVIQNQTREYQAAQERALRQYLNQQAEAAGPYGNLRSVERGAYERMGQNVGVFQADLYAREIETQRSELLQVLAMAGQFITAAEARALQEELSRLDRELSRLNSDREYSLRRAGL